jgi:AbrB family looped-hinge helix DNA binding protein
MASTAQKLGPKYQVTIPKPVRDALGLKVGDLAETTISRAGAVIRPVMLVRKKNHRCRVLEKGQGIL